jgi:hypothetical protein
MPATLSTHNLFHILLKLIISYAAYDKKILLKYATPSAFRRRRDEVFDWLSYYLTYVVGLPTFRNSRAIDY